MSSKRKSLNEEFARFFESPAREGLRELLKNINGEFPNLDFKEEWPALSKVARHILGLANSGGGCIIVGVAEMPDKTLEPKGIASLLDKADVIKGVKKYLPDGLLSRLELLDFSFDASEYGKIIGRRFQVVLADDDPRHLPYVATGSGDGVRETAIYVRRGTSTEEANNEELQRVINRRLSTGYSSQVEMDLQTHIEQLKVLFRQIDRAHVIVKGGVVERVSGALAKNTDFQNFLGRSEVVPNSTYPKEDFENFIARMIDRKKKRIEIELDVVDLTADSG